MIPKTIYVNNVELGNTYWNQVDLAAIGCEGWLLLSGTHDGAIGRWRLFHGGELVREAIFNLSTDFKTPSLKLRWDDLAFPVMLGSQEGHLWTMDGWAETVTDPGAATPWDIKYAQDYSDGVVDPPVTRYTGSANMEFHHHAGHIAHSIGFSPSIANWFNVYLENQYDRPRWWLDSLLALPKGLLNFETGMSGFNEWFEDDDGQNPWDAQHLDAMELYWGYKLTKDPAFLLALLQLWATVRCHSNYIKSPSLLWAGSVRTPGWWWILSWMVLDCLYGVSTPIADRIKKQVRESVFAHVSTMLPKFPIWNKAEGDSQKPWMYSPCLLGLWLIQGSDYLVHQDVGKLFETILGWVNELGKGITASGDTPIYRVFKDGRYETGKFPGVCNWYAAGMGHLEAIGSLPTGLLAVDWLVNEWKVTNVAHPYHRSQGIGMVPIQCGYSPFAVRER